MNKRYACRNNKNKNKHNQLSIHIKKSKQYMTRDNIIGIGFDMENYPRKRPPHRSVYFCKYQDGGYRVFSEITKRFYKFVDNTPNYSSDMVSLYD